MLCCFVLLCSCSTQEFEGEASNVLKENVVNMQPNSEGQTVSYLVTKDISITVYKNVFEALISQSCAVNTRGDINDIDVWNIISSSFSIQEKGDMMTVSEYFETLDMSEDNTRQLILDKVFLFENPYVAQTRAEAPSLEDIRNAMMDECENGYIEPITTPCKVAVLIAYYYKKMKS